MFTAIQPDRNQKFFFNSFLNNVLCSLIASHKYPSVAGSRILRLSWIEFVAVYASPRVLATLPSTVNGL